MAVASPTDFSPPNEASASPSRSSSDLASESPSRAASLSCAGADTLDRNALSSNSSPSPGRDSDVQSSSTLRSEEYRQLFRLPPEEVLIQDFNCAIQESILIQGHMYLFMQHICFYSNIFGFETKKIIPFHDIASVKRAKTAGIFPNAIEIFAGGKKYFFGSFISRDEAFKLINDGWLQHSNGGKEIIEQQESISISQESEILIEKVGSFKQVNKLDTNDRHKDAASSNYSSPSPQVENGIISITQLQDNVEKDVGLVENTDASSSTRTGTWNVENFDAPEIPESYTKVAETNFPLRVEEFFNLFFSDDAINFIESFHGKCGDKDFKCSSWKSHEKFGQVRNVSFQHPIKIYFGAKFGSCQEVQKFRVYRNSHLVIETSQEINDVPYGDYFHVQGLWDVVRDGDQSNEGCILRVHVDVAFIKKTVFKGKIVQSTIEECREAYAIWINMAHELLKQKNLEKQEICPTSHSVQNVEVHCGTELNAVDASGRLHKSSDHIRNLQISSSIDDNQHVDKFVQGNFVNATSIVSLLGEYMEKLCSFLKSQSQVSLILVTAFVVIFLMQMSILVLLNRTQNTQGAYRGNYYYYMGGMSWDAGGRSTAETLDWLERRVHQLKDEMSMVGVRLERLQLEYTWLNAQLKNFDNLGEHK